MEIEVGDYVRTRAGHFYKITRIDENGLEGEIYEANKDIAQKCIVLFPIN